jgi:hypothetical protein
MIITLQPETERLITHQAAPGKVQECQEAAARIRELRRGVTLGGLNIKDLIHLRPNRWGVM